MKPIWKKSAKTPTKNLEQKCVPVSLSNDAENCRTPLQFFSLFFSDDLISKIVVETNLYAQQANANLNVTKDEMYVVLGGIILSGYAKYPNKRMYWSNMNDCPKMLANAIRQKRFESILAHFHFNDNSKIDVNDRIYKLRPLVDSLNESFLKHGGVPENLSIDESMIPYYGKHYAKQYIKGKPIRFGYKIWAICSSTGYLLNFSIYTGKSDCPVSSLGLGGSVVMDLITKANIPPNKGHKLYFDRFFTSFKLMQFLSQKGYCASGTILENRTAKCSIKSSKTILKESRGYCDYRYDDNSGVLICSWKDNKVVTMATTFDSVNLTNCVRWSKEKKSKVNVPQPEMIANYNKGMGGVDLMDQMISVYRSRIRQRKWYWPIFLYLLDVSITNAWFLMRKVCPNDPKCSSLLNFRRELCKSILELYGTERRRSMSGAVSVSNDARYDGYQHMIDAIPNQRRCAECGVKAKFICLKCQKPLHPKTCFKSFHTMSN